MADQKKRQRERDRKPAEGEQQASKRRESETTPSTRPTAGASGKQGESQERGRFPALRGVEPEPEPDEANNQPKSRDREE